MFALWGGSLLVVLGLIVFLGNLVTRRFGLSGRSLGRGPELVVLHRAGLGPKQGLATVRFGDKIVLVGLGDGGVRFLCEEPAQGAPSEESAAIPEETGAVPAKTLMRPEKPRPKLFRAPHGLRLLGLAALLQVAAVSGLSGQVGAGQSSGANSAGRPQLQVEGAEEMLQRLEALAGSQQAGVLQTRQDSLAVISGAAGAFSSGGRRAETEIPEFSQILEALPQMSMQFGEGGGGEPLRLTGPVGTVLFIGFLTVLPTLLLMTTSFTRILIVLHLLKQAIGAQTVPPAHLLAAMAMLLTGFVMAPTLNEVNRTALAPWMAGEIETGEMFHEAAVPFRRFMVANTRTEDINTFIALRQAPTPRTLNDIPMVVLMTAFVTSELRTAFQIGFALFLPFLVIDLVVASVLMSMGMFMLPPVLVSLPFKLLLFVMVDGWPLVLGGVIRSFTT